MRPGIVVAFAVALVSCSDETSSPSSTTRPSGSTSSGSAGGDGGTIGPTNDASANDSGTGDSGKPLGPPRVYVGSGDGKIRLYTFDMTTGALTLSDTTNAGSNPSFIAFTPDHRFLYTTDEGSAQVLAFAVEHPSGKLSALGGVGSGGNGPTHVSVDRNGNYVMVANYGGGTISVLSRGTDGKLGSSTATRSFGGGAQTHEILTDPTNAFVLVPNKGLDAVSVFRLATNGSLTDVSLSGYAAGDGARHLAVDAQSKHVYVINENASSVSVMTMDPTTGMLASVQTLSSLEPGFVGSNTGAEIALTPDGKHVIASNRGDNSLMVFDVNATDGKLTRTQRVSTGGNTPRHFSIDETGKFVFVGNQGSGNVVVMKVDSTTGVPSPLGSPLSVASPGFVALVYL